MANFDDSADYNGMVAGKAKTLAVRTQKTAEATAKSAHTTVRNGIATALNGVRDVQGASSSGTGSTAGDD